MSISIKTPSDSIAGKGFDPKSKPHKGTYNGCDGYEKRTSTPNGVPELTYDGAIPMTPKNVVVKTPATEKNSRK